MLHLICQQIWKTQQWLQDWKRSIFIPIPKKSNAKECSNYWTTALISHANKVMLKILQANSTWTVNFQMFKLDLEKAEEPEIKLSTSTGSSKKQEISRKNIYSFFIDYTKAFNCVDHKKLWKILQEMRIPDHLTCLLRNLYAGQEATELDMEQLTGSKYGKGVWQGCLLSPCLFNLYAEYMMWNARQD